MKRFSFSVFTVIASVLFILGLLSSPLALAQEEAENQSQTAGESQDQGIKMNGAMGATIINGVSYQFFSLRPDIPIWKFGIGLDLSFYFDSEGKLREEDWDEAADIIDKIYYLRYGKPGDKLYIRAGSLAPITLGYGLIMRRYTNAIEWPQVRRVGLQTKIRHGPFNFEGLVNNFRELDTPGLVGARLTYEHNFGLPIVFGGNIVHDGNQYLAAKDDDDDGIPDRLDMFPDMNDGEHIDWLRGLLTPTQVVALINSRDIPDINNPPDNILDKKEPVTIIGVDAGVPLIRNNRMSLWAYVQAAQIADYGRGYAVPGLVFRMSPFYAGFEYRIFEKKFLGDFFNLSYELERVVWDDDEQEYLTKENRLIDLPSATGIYVDAGANLFNMIDLYASYQQMFYDGDRPNKSLYTTVTLNTEFIPKINLLEGYFQQPNAEKVFSRESDGTVVGYKVGAAMGGGVMLVYDNKTIYHNGEPNRVMTVETVIRF